MADAIKGMAATLAKGTTAIVNITEIDLGQTEGSVMETTNLSSTNGIRTFETAGLFMREEITISGNYDPSAASHIALKADSLDGSGDSYTLTFSNSDTFAFDAIVTSFGTSNPMDGPVTFTATLKLDGTSITDPS